MADAFAALLAEEQGEGLPPFLDVARDGPNPLEGPPLAQESLELSDAVIDRIATRVADRLMQGLLGQNITRVVTEVSERLVREEIARIRSGTKSS